MSGNVKPDHAKALAKAVGIVIKQELGKVSQNVEDLRQRVAELEAQQSKSLADAYRGGFQPNTEYERGNVCTHHGSLWLAMADTKESPGSTASWRMIVKGSTR